MMSDVSGVRPARRRRHPILRGLETVLVMVVMVLVALALLLAFALRHEANGQTSLFGRPIFSVASGSMTPTFDTGDLIIDQPISLTAAEHLHKGQVISFQAAQSAGNSAGLVITHRIYAVVSGPKVAHVPAIEYRTKGDANNAPDVGLVAPSAILGLYQGERVPLGGYAISALHQPITFVFLVMIVVVYLAEELIRRRWIALGDEEVKRRQARADREGQL